MAGAIWDMGALPKWVYDQIAAHPKNTKGSGGGDAFYGEATATVKTNQEPDFATPAKESGLLPPTLQDDSVRRARLGELAKLLSGKGRKSTFLTDGLTQLRAGGPTSQYVGGDFGRWALPTLGRPTTLGGGT